MTEEMVLVERESLVRQADNDLQLVDMFIRSKESEKTRVAYRNDVARFSAFVGKPLRHVTLADAQDYAANLEKTHSAASRQRMLASVKSLFAFGLKLGYLPFDVMRVIKLPKKENKLAERILSEQEVMTIIALEPNERNRILIRTLYVTAGRVSEVCGLEWRNLRPRHAGGQITLYGKGGKTRTVLVPARLFQDLIAAKSDGDEPESPVFASREGNKLSPVQAWRIVRTASKRAGIKGNVSPHWFRHSHATHAIERKESLSLVQATLGHSSIAVTGQYLHANPDDSSAMRLAIS